MAPSANPPAGFEAIGWDGWLADTTVNGGGGKSLQPDPANNELLVVSSGAGDPLPVTVSVCWRHLGRVIGECQAVGAGLGADPAAGGDVTIVESPVMLSTRMTCRHEG